MSIYLYRPVKLDAVKTYPLHSRASKVAIADFARVPRPQASIREWTRCLPNILAGQSFRDIISALERARKKRKPIIWGLGGHVIKCGLSPILLHLMSRGYLTAVAMNGSTLIHDVEVAMEGFTSEDVPKSLG